MCPHPHGAHAITVGDAAARTSDSEQSAIEVTEGRRSVRLPSDNDVEITVDEDEPVKGAVEEDIASIEAKKESRIRRYFDKWKGGIDTALPFPSARDAFIGWLGAFLG